MTKTLEVIVSPHGETTVETKGFSGTACRDASRELEIALGSRVAEHMTSEYHRSMAEYAEMYATILSIIVFSALTIEALARLETRLFRPEKRGG